MASVDVASLSKAEHDELCCAYAALLLHDGEIEITVSVCFPNLFLINLSFLDF